MIEQLPSWVTDELMNPVPMGSGRNDQMIRIGPTLVRAGHDADSLFDLFWDLYGDLDQSHEREIQAVVRQSIKYAAKEEKTIIKSEWIERRKFLNKLMRDKKAILPEVLRDFHWEIDEMRDDFMAKVPLAQQRILFLDAMFEPEDIIWIGQVWETGQREKRGKRVNYQFKFKPCEQWLCEGIPGRSEFVSHCTFQPGTNSRCNDSVAERKFMVVESDVIPVEQIGAIFNYLSQHQNLNLRAIVTTGGKSIHGWFDRPTCASDDTMEEWAAVLEGLSCDPSTLRPSQPVRLPGTTRRDTGRPQELLWLR